MNRRFLIVFFAVAWVGTVPTIAAAQCLPSTAASELVERMVTPVARGTDSTSVKYRQYYRLVHVPPTEEIEYVSDSTVCGTAAAALAAGSDPSVMFPRGVWVLKVGPSRYIVFDFEQIVAGHMLLDVFDSNFVHLVAFPF